MRYLSSGWTARLAICLLVVSATPGCKLSRNSSGTKFFYENAARRDATALEASYVVQVLSGCAAFFVANTKGLTILGSAAHCFEFDPRTWCKSGGGFLDNQRRRGSCVQVVADHEESDIVFLKAKFDYQPSPDQQLHLTSYTPTVDMRLSMIGYPADRERRGKLTVTDNCRVLSGTVPNPYAEGDDGHPLQDLSTQVNCSVYGGNSGGPMILENTHQVLGLPSTYDPDDRAPRPADGGPDPDIMAQIAGFVADNKPVLTGLGIVIDAAPPASSVPEQLREPAELAFVKYCSRTDLSTAEQKTMQAIRGQYGDGSCSGAARDFTGSVEISLMNKGISDLGPMIYATKVQTLYLSGNNITDVTPLASLKTLTQLDLSGSPVADYSPLAQSPKLWGLTLNNCGITSLATFSKDLLKKLYSLSLDGNPVTDLSALQGSMLNTLSLNHVTTPDLAGLLSGVAQTTTIYRLSLQGVGNLDLKALSQVHSLRYLTSLDLSGNNLSDLSAIGQFKYLSTFVARNNQITDLTGLSSLNRLRSLNLSGNQIQNLQPLTSLADYLQVLNLSNNRITDLSPLSVFEGLTDLSLGGNPLTSRVCPLKDASPCDFSGPVATE